MRTKATYRIMYKNSYRDSDVYIYCHHDNYPRGAALRFKNTLELINSLQKKCINNDFLECFIATNINSTNVKLTSSHDAHSDTSYSYDITITDDNIYLKFYNHYFVNGQEFYTEKSLSYEGLLIDFINSTTRIVHKEIA